MLEGQAAFVTLQPAGGPSPLHPLTEGVRELGAPEGRTVGRQRLDELELFHRERAPVEGDRVRDLRLPHGRPPNIATLTVAMRDAFARRKLWGAP